MPDYCPYAISGGTFFFTVKAAKTILNCAVYTAAEEVKVAKYITGKLYLWLHLFLTVNLSQRKGDGLSTRHVKAFRVYFKYHDNKH